MTEKYEFEPGVALLLVMRLIAQKQAGIFDGIGERELADAHRKHDAELGRKTRKLLRSQGFEPDCEIDVEMERLAAIAYKSLEDLGSYIQMQSPKVAKFLAEHGDQSLEQWQLLHPTPIRPNDRN